MGEGERRRLKRERGATGGGGGVRKEAEKGEKRREGRQREKQGKARFCGFKDTLLMDRMKAY